MGEGGFLALDHRHFIQAKMSTDEHLVFLQLVVACSNDLYSTQETDIQTITQKKGQGRPQYVSPKKKIKTNQLNINLSVL